jgi:hypothetical protein
MERHLCSESWLRSEVDQFVNILVLSDVSDGNGRPIMGSIQVNALYVSLQSEVYAVNLAKICLP